MRAIKIIRVAKGKHSTLSQLYIGGLFCCYLLEDTVRDHKVPGETAIPPGNYGLSLNHWAGMNATYAKRYPHMHEGMVEIIEIPNYQLVFFHAGNDHTDTSGCPLAGLYWVLVNGDYEVRGSRAAYEFAYPKLLAEINKGNNRLVVENRLLLS
ncbi:DUF5675 family protein [Parapedobacter soli]|uniref:DUF5675 family protein n=1 Tax=Parapedobacter soli TaxID=416955 RepID=UPI0021CADEF0|nr:DUF5675 family protein [Parapedobacter soli]